MEHETTLLVFGILLLLIGLVGQVKARELEIGTSNILTRAVIGLIGVLFIVLSFIPMEKVIDKIGGSEQSPTTDTVSESISDAATETVSDLGRETRPEPSSDDQDGHIDAIQEKRIDELQKAYYIGVMVPLLDERLKTSAADGHYRELITQNDPDITLASLKIVIRGLFNREVRPQAIKLLQNSIWAEYLTKDQEIISYYLMLSGLVIGDMSEDYRGEFERYSFAVRQYQKEGKSIRDIIENEIIDPETFIFYLWEEEKNDRALGNIQSRKMQLQELWDSVP